MIAAEIAFGAFAIVNKEAVGSYLDKQIHQLIRTHKIETIDWVQRNVNIIKVEQF